jgi:hypothetical protein
MIWWALIIPLVAVISLLTSKKIVLWEYLILFGIPSVAIVITYFISLSARQIDTEYWNGYVNSAIYYQSWQTWDRETCYKNVNCHEVCTGSDENKICSEHCDRVAYDCSHCDNYPEEWEASDNLGNEWRITSATYETWANMWHNKVFVELNRHIEFNTGLFGGCGKDGDAYRVTYNNDTNKIIPVVIGKHYINKVQTTYKELDTSIINEYELFNYPIYDRFNYNPVLGINDFKVSKRLANWNAILGKSKQVHMLLLVFHNKTIEAAEYQEKYWRGGNKNEFILTVGVNKVCEWDSTLPGISCGDIIQWAKVISFTDQRGLKSKIESIVSNMKNNIDYKAIVDTMAINVSKSFIRKDWDYYDSISVQPSKTAIIITYIITFIFTGGIVLFVLFNDINRTDFKEEEEWKYKQLKL